MWLPFLEQAEPNIRMCINYGSTKEEEAAEMNDWCLSHAFDYVDMNEVKSDVPFDKVGIELALDIIQTNLWEGMVKKKKKKMTEQEEEQDLIRGNIQNSIHNIYSCTAYAHRNSGITAI